MGHYGVKQIDIDDLWRPDEETEALIKAYLEAADSIGASSMEVGKLVGASIDWTLTNPFISEVRDQLAKEIKGINDTTRDQVAEVIEKGVQRGYSIPQIANGFPAERYKGITGVFDAADEARAETIARTETAKLFNNAALLAYEDAGITHVEVLDGKYDTICEEANGSRWTLAEAAAKPLAHPNCVRSFIPLVTVKARRRRIAAGAVAALSPGDPNFRESEVRRDPGGQGGGQFVAKPDQVQPPKPRKPGEAQPKPEARPRTSAASNYLTQIGVPAEVVSDIERLGLDEPVAARKGEVAQRLLGSFKDTKEKFTDPETGAYSKERRELHDRIIDLMLRQKKPVYDPEKGRVEWQLDPEGVHIERASSMKTKVTDTLVDLQRQLTEAETHDEGGEEGVRLRAEIGAWQETLARLEDGRKRSMFMAGGNASGKSVAMYSGENESFLRPDGATLEVNFDLIKEQIPEFQEMAAAHDIYGTDGTHFESEDISRRLLEEGRVRGLNTVVDASGDSTKQGFIETIREQKKAGYDTEVLMVDAPVEDAIRDMLKRAFRTGRYVPTPVMTRIHKNSVSRFLEWQDDTAVDEWKLYRRHGGELTLTAHGGKGMVTVDDENEYEAIQVKAGG